MMIAQDRRKSSETGVEMKSSPLATPGKREPTLDEAAQKARSKGKGKARAHQPPLESDEAVAKLGSKKKEDEQILEMGRNDGFTRAGGNRMKLKRGDSSAHFEIPDNGPSLF